MTFYASRSRHATARLTRCALLSVLLLAFLLGLSQLRVCQADDTASVAAVEQEMFVDATGELETVVAEVGLLICRVYDDFAVDMR